MKPPARASVVAGLRDQFGRLALEAADGPSVGLTAGELEAAGVRVSPSQIDALVALGVLDRSHAGGEPRVVWAWDRPPASAPSGPLAPQGAADGELGRARTPPVEVDVAAVQEVALRAEEFDSDVAAAQEVALRAEEFELDVAADYEHERLLMYRVIIAFEAVIGIVLVRELVPRLV